MKTTIVLDNVEVEIEYGVVPPERRTLEYPGCPAQLEIHNMVALLDDHEDSIAEQLWDDLNEG